MTSPQVHAQRPWVLLRVWHVEADASVIEKPYGMTATRTSYVSAPLGWRRLPQMKLVARLEQLLDAACRRRAATPRVFVFFYEWVERANAPGDPRAAAEPWVLPHANAHAALVERACFEIDRRLRAPRNGIAARGYDDAFEVFAIDNDGRWRLLDVAERAAVLASRHG